MHPEAPVDALDGVVAARASGHGQAALTLALAEWHRTKHPVIAQVVEVLSAEALELFSAPATKNKEAFHQAWLEVARERDDVARGWLALTLTQKVPTHQHGSDVDPERRFTPFFERLDALTHQVADPRLASALCTVLEEPELMIFGVERSRPIYAPVASLIIAQGDVRCISRLRQLETTPRAKHKTLREVVAELINPLVTGLLRVEVTALQNEAGWRALLPEPAVRAPSASEPALLEAVYASPRDDQVRSVYADALLERGDVRGELISLQLAAKPTPKQRKRVNALLKAHRTRWLGPLAAVLKHLVFERGFLRAAELSQNSVATEKVWQAAAGDARLGTVEELRQGRGNAKHYTAFLASGALRNLRRLELPSYQLLPLLGRAPFSHSVEHVLLPNRGSLQHLEKLGALALPSLSTLTTPLMLNESGQWLQYLISSGLINRLRHYKVTGGWGVSQPLVHEVFARWSALGRPLSLAVQTVSSPEQSPRHLMLERTGDGETLRLLVHASFENEAKKLLSDLNHPVTEVHLFDREAWGISEHGLRRAAESRGATLHLHPGGVPSAAP